MSSHILRAPETTTEAEKEQLDKLDKYQKKYLSRMCCGLCDLQLNQIGCGSFYKPCSESLRIERRAKCLKEYKPRLYAMKKK